MDIERDQSEKKCQQIKQILKDIKVNIQQNDKSKIDPLQPYQQLMSLRSLFRDVVLELEARRVLVKTKKEQIQKSKTYLDGLEYFKSMLKTQIEICQVEVEDISEIIEQKLDLEWTDKFPGMKEKIENWVQDSKKQKRVLNDERMHKDQILQAVTAKKNLYKQQLPEHLKRVSENLVDMVGLFGIEPVYLLNPIKNKKLLKIYNFFQPLKQSGDIQMQYADEMVSVTIFLKSSHPAFKLCNQIKCPIEQKTVKINFLCILDDILVAGVDHSRSDFNNQQIFHRLVNQQPLSLLFPHPKSQQQRNNNNRFVKFNWIDLIANTKDNLDISSSDFVKKVNDRILALVLTRYLITSLRDNKFLFYFRVIKQGETGSVHLKKFTVSIISKINFEQFKKLNNIPFWSNESLQNPNIKYSKIGQRGLSWTEFLLQLNLEQLKQPRMNEYFKVSMNFHQNNIQFVIIMPHNYPQRQTTIKIISISKKKQERRSPALPQPILALNVHTTGMSIQNAIRAQSIENEINSKLSEFVKDNYLFYAFYQINRLITLLQEAHTVDSNSECVVSKLMIY